MRKAWFGLTLVLGVLGTYTLINSIYWVIIGYSTQYGAEFVVGTFIFSIILLVAAYESWKKIKNK